MFSFSLGDVDSATDRLLQTPSDALAIPAKAACFRKSRRFTDEGMKVSFLFGEARGTDRTGRHNIKTCASGQCATGHGPTWQNEMPDTLPDLYLDGWA